MLLTATGIPVQVGPKIASGGQGEIFVVNSPARSALKRFHESELKAVPDLRRRIETMVAQAPKRGAATGHVRLTWPTAVVLDRGRFVGFLMPLLDVRETVELHRVSNPSDRRNPIGGNAWIHNFNWRYLVTTAANLATVVSGLHPDVVIGDFNERNVRVSREALVTLIDCDSMQVTNPLTGERFYCGVHRPEFLAPELAGANLRSTLRHPSSDLYPLAIDIYQLLLEGEHPFRGRWGGTGEKPPVPQLARNGVWSHGPGTLKPRRTAPNIGILPAEITGLFRRAFEQGARRPTARPPADEWERQLRSLAGNLADCPRDRRHVYYRALPTCPWCWPAGVGARREAFRRPGSLRPNPRGSPWSTLLLAVVAGPSARTPRSWA